MPTLRSSMLALSLLLSVTSLSARSIFEEFTVSLSNAQLSGFSQSAIHVQSQSPEYDVKLEPNVEGAIMFSLGRHRFSTTVMPKNLLFGVRIEGYLNGEVVMPDISLDDTYPNVHLDGNMVVFQRIHYPIPVVFEAGVDSIKLHFSNSHGYNFYQYCTLTELQVLESVEAEVNPMYVDCEQQSIMIAVQGSSSIDKAERKTISKALTGLFKAHQNPQDSNQVSILEFGKGTRQISSSSQKKALVTGAKAYKKGAKSETAKSSITNWESALDQALEQGPDIFIMVTNSWSNYAQGGLATMSAQHANLVRKCNEIKANGTRLLFITSGLYQDEGNNSKLLSMLNDEYTNHVAGAGVNSGMNLRAVDLISMDGFDKFQMVDLSSLLSCGEDEDDLQPE